jgi:hypothetical protein
VGGIGHTVYTYLRPLDIKWNSDGICGEGHHLTTIGRGRAEAGSNAAYAMTVPSRAGGSGNEFDISVR